GGKDAAAVQVGCRLAQVVVDMSTVLLRPHQPVRQRPASIGVWALAHDQVLPERRDLAEARAHAQPVRHAALLVGSGRTQVESDGAVDRALLDGLLAQTAIRRVDPAALGSLALPALCPRA